MAGRRFTFGRTTTEKGVTGRKALFERMTIGNPECPIFERLTLFRHPKLGAIRIHKWYPLSIDLNIHDHPWGFITIVLQGNYEDLVPCPQCEGSGSVKQVLWHDGAEPPVAPVICSRCGGKKVICADKLKRGSIRYRKATHRHGTYVGPNGCLTIVFSGRVIREWGFWTTFTNWMPWKQHHEEFGEGANCEEARK